MYRKPDYLKVYMESQIESRYNDIPVMWCQKCLSLHILTLDNGRSIPEKYCDKCLSTDIVVGHIFQYLKIHPVKSYRNLKEYQQWRRRVENVEIKDAIAQEIEDEINSLYVNDYWNIN